MESLAYVLTTGWASGISGYGTLLVTGLLGRYGGVERVPDVLERTDVLLVVAALTAVEFVADKIPYIDRGWDAVHTAIRACRLPDPDDPPRLEPAPRACARPTTGRRPKHAVAAAAKLGPWRPHPTTARCSVPWPASATRWPHSRSG